MSPCLPRSRESSFSLAVAMAATTVLLVAACSPAPMTTPGAGGESGPGDVPTTNSYDDLVTLFGEWREFEAPPFVEGVPDYSLGTMGQQHLDLAGYRARLDAIDTSAWPVSEKVDWHLVRAEMNGLDFYHRVLRPWERDPAFYVSVFAAESDVPAHEGPVIHGWIDPWTYEYPLSVDDAAELADRLGAIPALLQQARANLVGDARDLWVAGIDAHEGQVRDLDGLAERVAGTNDELDAAIESARGATEGFVSWLEAEAPSKTGPSGVGVDDYDWYLQYVHLVPYTWHEIVTMMRRELARSWASLKLEEHRNRELPEQERIGSTEEYDRRFNDAVTEFATFLADEEIVSPRDFMDPALRARIGRFSPADGLRGFFSEIGYRDPLTMRTHGYHWVDLARMAEEPHASQVRRVPLLYNIFDGRAEGVATGMEEWMMHAGLFAESPRSRELIWILVAQRAARALGGLYMHANEWTLEEACEFAGRWTPRGWMPADSSTCRGEQHLYLRQPFYGDSYLVGKHQVERLMADRALQIGDEFTLRGFIDEFEAAGVVPLSLIRWELTGYDDEVARMTAAE